VYRQRGEPAHNLILHFKLLLMNFYPRTMPMHWLQIASLQALVITLDMCPAVFSSTGPPSQNVIFPDAPQGVIGIHLNRKEFKVMALNLHR
jgi:hypothetical protein